MSDTNETVSTISQSQQQRNLLHRWSLNFTDDTTNVSAPPQPQRSQSIRAAIESNLHPPGFPTDLSAKDPTPFTSSLNNSTNKTNKSSTRKASLLSTTTSRHPSASAMQAAYAKSWNIAFSPVRALCTSGFALYVSGSRLSVFSLVTTITVLFVQIRSVLATRSAFRPIFKIYPLPIVSIIPQAIVHIVICGIGVAYGLIKANLLGFLPTTESDWIALLPLHTVAPMTFRHSVAMN